MHIRRVRADEDAMRRYMEELWLPYHRDLGESVDDHELADDVDLDEMVDHHTDLYDSPGRRLWVALDDVDDPTASLDTVDATFAGFLGTALKASPDPFEFPDRSVLGDFYLKEPYRGSGLADELVARAAQAAREDGCEELELDVDIDNERALGFEPHRKTPTIDVDAL